MARDENARYEIASVLSRSFETIGANIALFLGLALIFSGIPSIALQWWQTEHVTTVQAGDFGAMFNLSYLGPLGLGWLIGAIAGAVLQAALTRATVTHLSGERPDFARCLAVGVTMILPMFAISILLAFGVGFATLLLIVPGVILWLAWSVTVPVYVQEKVGIFEAFGRSAALTKGARWRIFLTMLILVIGLWLCSIPLAMISAAAGAMGSVMFLSVFAGVISALGSMVTVTVQASIYVELRDVKEGVAPADLEAIFA